MSTVNIEIDGQKLKVPQGTMVIEAADNACIPIPRFCYHKKLSIAANCRMCLVEVEKAPKPLPACATPVSEGMKIFTKSDYAKEAQKSVMEFLLINHPLDCPVCDQGGQCELQDVALEYGRDVSRFSEGKRAVASENIGPLIATDMTRCIHCTRCVRFGDEVAGLRELGATGRGEHMEIGTYIEHSVASEISGNVIDICPVGALTSKPFRFKARAWELKSRASVAAHDALGSNLFHHSYQNKIVRTVPRENEQINEVWLSDRDRFAYEGLYHAQRLFEPEIKRNGQWQQVTWEQALEFAAERIHHTVKEHSPNQLGAVISPNCTTEEHYLLSKLMRSIGSKNIDHRLRTQDFSAQSYHKAYPGFSSSLDQLENSEVIFLIGCHPRTEAPLINQRLLKASKHGAQILSLQAFADEHRYALDTEIIVERANFVPYLAGIAKALMELNPDPKLIPEGVEALLKLIQPDDTLKALACTLNSLVNTTMIVGQDALSHPQADSIQFFVSLIAQLANVKINELTVGANAAGAWLTGCVPHRNLIGETTPTEPGLSCMSMFKDPLKAMILVNLEPEFDCIHPSLAIEGLKQVDDVICLSPYVTETMREYADVLLPMSPVPETEGTFINLLGDWQSFKAVVPPLGDSKPGWKVLRVLANILGVSDFEFNTSQEVLSEFKQRFEQAQQEDDLPKSELLSWLPKTLGLSQSGLIRLSKLALYGTNNVVRRAQSLQSTPEHQGCQAAYINAHTAKKLGIREGEQVRVSQDSRLGKMSLPVAFDQKVPEDCVLVYSGIEASCDLGTPFSTIELNIQGEG